MSCSTWTISLPTTSAASSPLCTIYSPLTALAACSMSTHSSAWLLWLHCHAPVPSATPISHVLDLPPSHVMTTKVFVGILTLLYHVITDSQAKKLRITALFLLLFRFSMQIDNGHLQRQTSTHSTKRLRIRIHLSFFQYQR